jgi:hypothetical protein
MKRDRSRFSANISAVAANLATAVRADRPSARTLAHCAIRRWCRRATGRSDGTPRNSARIGEAAADGRVSADGLLLMIEGKDRSREAHPHAR